MILSLKNNFLLLKNQKVGGTSLEVPLSRIMPADAIITPKTSDDPAWKLSDEPIYKDYNPRNYEGFYNHMSYSEINNKISLSGVKSYIFIRNPFEMVLSHFFHRLKFEGLNTKWLELTDKEQSKLLFKYFNGELGWGWLKSNRHLYTSKEGTIQINEFLRYENGIEKEINKILPLHNLPKITLDIQEKSFRPKQIHYHDIFLDNHIKLIKQEWSWELEYFGYKYE